MIVLYYAGKPNQKYRGAVTGANYTPQNDFLRCYDEDVDGLLDLRADGQPVFMQWKPAEKAAEAPKQVWINMMPVEGRFPEKKDEEMIKVLHYSAPTKREFSGSPSGTVYKLDGSTGSIRAYMRDVEFLLMQVEDGKKIFSLFPIETGARPKLEVTIEVNGDNVTAEVPLPELINGEEEKESKEEVVACFDFTLLSRVGQARADSMISAGMCTLDDLLAYTADELSVAINVRKNVAQSIIESAIKYKSEN